MYTNYHCAPECIPLHYEGNVLNTLTIKKHLCRASCLLAINYILFHQGKGGLNGLEVLVLFPAFEISERNDQEGREDTQDTQEKAQQGRRTLKYTGEGPVEQKDTQKYRRTCRVEGHSDTQEKAQQGRRMSRNRMEQLSIPLKLEKSCQTGRYSSLHSLHPICTNIDSFFSGFTLLLFVAFLCTFRFFIQLISVF